MKTGASSVRVLTPVRRRANQKAFSLVEVLVTMVLITLMCASVFPGLQLITTSAMNTAIRGEAHRLMQDEAERLISVGYASFTTSDEQTITSSIKTTFGPDKSSQFQYPSNQAGRVTFKRRVVAVADTSTTRTLRVEVEWTWRGKKTVISMPIFRSV